MPGSVAVARQPLELKSLVRIQAGQHRAYFYTGQAARATVRPCSANKHALLLRFRHNHVRRGPSTGIKHRHRPFRRIPWTAGATPGAGGDAAQQIALSEGNKAWPRRNR